MGRRRGRGLPHPQNLLSRGARGGGKHSSVSGPDPRVPGLWTTWSRCLAPVLESRGVGFPAELLKGEDAWRPSRPGLPPGDRQPHPGTTGQVLQGAVSQPPALHGQDSPPPQRLSGPQCHPRRGGETLPWRGQTSSCFTDLLGPQAAKRGRGGWSCRAARCGAWRARAFNSQSQTKAIRVIVGYCASMGRS